MALNDIGETLTNGIRLTGETLLAPGASLLLQGRIVNGGLHLIAGVAARALIGPVGWFIVAANSYSEAASGQNLLQQVGLLSREPKTEVAAGS